MKGSVTKRVGEVGKAEIRSVTNERVCKNICTFFQSHLVGIRITVGRSVKYSLPKKCVFGIFSLSMETVMKKNKNI